MWGGWREVARELSKSSRAMSILYTLVGRWIVETPGVGGVAIGGGVAAHLQ